MLCVVRPSIAVRSTVGTPHQAMAENMASDSAVTRTRRASTVRTKPLARRYSTPAVIARCERRAWDRSEEHTSELQSLMRISYAVFCLYKKKQCKNTRTKHMH